MKKHYIIILIACNMYNYGQETLDSTKKGIHIFDLPNEILSSIAEKTITNKRSSPKDYTALPILMQTSRHYNKIVNNPDFLYKVIATFSRKNNSINPITPLIAIKNTEAAKTVFLTLAHQHCIYEKNHMQMQDISLLPEHIPYAHISNMAWLIFCYKIFLKPSKFLLSMHQNMNDLINSVYTCAYTQTILYFAINSIGRHLHLITTYQEIADYIEKTNTQEAHFISKLYQQNINDLHKAVITGNRRYMNIIIMRGISPDATKKNEYYNTPLIKAVNYNHKHIIQYLLKAGSNTNICDYKGHTPLHHACQKSVIIDIMDILIAHGANINAMSRTNTTPLLIAAVENSCPKKLKILLKHGARPNIRRQKKGTTPLFIAINCHHINVAHCLIAHEDTDVNIATYRNRTPLMRAAEFGHISIVQALLKKGANKNTIHETGNTALSFAEKNGHNDITKMLRQ